jgi:hypothetical protein
MKRQHLTQSVSPALPPPYLTRSEIAQLDRLNQVKENRGFPQVVRNRAELKIQAFLKARAQKADSVWINHANLETLALAEARGELVVRAAAPTGPACISSRDGLKALFEAGHFSESHFAAGLGYRCGYENRSSDLRAADPAPRDHVGHDNDLYCFQRMDQAQRSLLVGKIDRAVAVNCRAFPSSLAMLRRIAGEGHSLAAWGKGRVLENNRAALVAALEQARLVLGIPLAA